MSKIELYSLCAADGIRHYSPHVWKVILALKHKGLDFTLKPVSFSDIPKIAGGGFTNVPVLDDNGRLEDDSFKIAKFLDQEYNGAKLFPIKEQETLARMVEHHCNTVLNPRLSVIVVRQMHDMMSPADQAHFRSTRQRRFAAGIEELETRSAAELAQFPEKLSLMRTILSEQPWIAGSTPAFADHILFSSLQWHRVCTASSLMLFDDPVEQWFQRCVEKYDINLTRHKPVS